ncbi:MAG: hypothetical protein ACJZ8P_01045 [Alphaproteobacteria bacterium]|tara:strand:- start:515 stop:811 length:297 start_codon:yes stop_codon:yes gene_type:complete
MRNVIIIAFLTLLLSVPSYAQYKEPKLRNNLNIYKKERETKKIATSIKDECKYLKLNAISLVKEAYLLNKNNNINSDEEMKLIKDAHYFSVNWSSLCD